MGWLQPIVEVRLRTRESCSLGHRRSGPHQHARGSSHCSLGQALAVEHTPRIVQWKASGVLPRRIHVPFQPSHISITRPVILSSGRTGRADGPIALPTDRRKRTQHIGATCFKWIPPFIKIGRGASRVGIISPGPVIQMDQNPT